MMMSRLVFDGNETVFDGNGNENLIFVCDGNENLTYVLSYVDGTVDEMHQLFVPRQWYTSTKNDGACRREHDFLKLAIWVYLVRRNA